MKKEFTKADLKDGMVVEQTDKCRYLVLGDKIIDHSGYNGLSQFAEDLTNVECGNEFDIVKVYNVVFNGTKSLVSIFYDENLELIWERKKIKHMTVEEMQKKLEELTGEKIKVKPSRGEMMEEFFKYDWGAL